MGLPSKFDTMRQLCSELTGQRGFRVENMKDLIIAALAGVTFVETDFPLDLASKGLALVSFNHDSQHSGEYQKIAKSHPETL